ncbi:hypothetical protein KEM56_006483 [Ascosphaera pollenicola]|nr:hypothetical protein KEM56_006483 [Ascosphaera pollenicola]
MSNEAQPITREAFALALKDLSVPIIYGKVSEIRNSLAHLQRSNGEMQAYIDEGIEGKEELEEAIAENAIVAERMQTRIELCRMELERRGAKWVDDAIREEAKLTTSMSDGAAAEGTGAAAGGREEERPTGRQPAATPATRSVDGAHEGHGEGDDEEGVYL